MRLGLESLLTWVLAECAAPCGTDDLAARLVRVLEVPESLTLGEWLAMPFQSATAFDPVAHPVSLVESLESERQRERADLALEAIKAAVLIARNEISAVELYGGQTDRLPLALVSERLKQVSTFSLREGLELILAEWVIGQHIYWAVGRSGDDTQRLRIMLDEGGWLSFHSPWGNARATPDRLETVLRLMADFDFIHEDRTATSLFYSSLPS
jgi:hypothetical protein